MAYTPATLQGCYQTVVPGRESCPEIHASCSEWRHQLLYKVTTTVSLTQCIYAVIIFSLNISSEMSSRQLWHTHTRLTALCPVLPGWVSARKVKTNVDFTEARDSEWQWHQLGHMQVCTMLQTDNHTSTPTTQFFTDQVPFLPPNQQRQSTEGMSIRLGKKSQKGPIHVNHISSNKQVKLSPMLLFIHKQQKTNITQMPLKIMKGWLQVSKLGSKLYLVKFAVFHPALATVYIDYTEI